MPSTAHILTPNADGPKTPRVLRAVIAILFVAGCGSSKGPPPCAAVGAKLVVLAQAELDKATLDEATRRLVLDQLPAMRDTLVNVCNDTKWDPAVRTCMVDATDHATFEQCEGALNSTQREALERGLTDER